ncbi:hypothetical protein [Shinella sp.]|uniref:hypothetical protein n=1 Tax=Shinella sp. TaxID=1870904 RepID=UPI0028B2421E|nr:hypothetical protein [Shinella sp.]
MKTERVTDEMVERAKTAWNSISDEYNGWDALSQEERDTYVSLTAALSSAEEKAVEVKKLEIDELVEELLDAQQNINLAAYSHMDQSLCDASALIDRVEAFLLRIRSALVDVPAVESEPVAWAYPETLARIQAKREKFEQHTLSLERCGNFTVPLYAHPPRSSLIQSEEGEIAQKARALASAILANYGSMEDGDGNEAPELAMARDILALSTPPSPYGGDNGDGAATGTKGGEPTPSRPEASSTLTGALPLSYGSPPTTVAHAAADDDANTAATGVRNG